MPNKSLGQHWLTDEATLAAICGFAGLTPQDTVLEIGPGLGTLTEVLRRNVRRIVAVEFDETLAQALRKRFAASALQTSQARVTVHYGDILSFDLGQLPEGYKVVANVPYYITSAIVRSLLESQNPPTNATLLVQREVAERIAAAPGAMSMLSVASQFFGDVRLGPIVPAAMFSPPPKVDSQAVRLDHTGPRFADIDQKQFFRVVKAGFGERRKKLRSSLAGGLGLEKPAVDGLLESAGVDPNVRAQQLSLEEWRSVAIEYARETDG